MADYDEDEEYEVVSMTPLRRLEKKIQRLEEKHSDGDQEQREFVMDVMDLVKSNQKLVDQVVEANNQLRQDLQSIPPKIDELLNSWQQFMDILQKAASEETAPGVPSGGLEEKLDELIDLNKQVLESNRDLKEAIEESSSQSEGGSRGRRRRRRSGESEGTSEYPSIRVKRE